MRTKRQLEKLQRELLLKSAANAAENVEKRFKSDGIIISESVQRLLNRLKKPSKS